MNYIKPIEEFLNEAISMKMYKENLPRDKYGRVDLLPDDGWGWQPKYRSLWDELFGVDSKGAPIYRLSIPLLDNSLSNIPSSTPLMDEINSIFEPLGYKINSFFDYIDNKAFKIGDIKNPLKIGKLLTKIDKTLFSRYDTDPDKSKWKQILTNKDKPLKIIISRHPYDLLGMTSGRKWRNSSCMRLGSENDKVYRDILCDLEGRDAPSYESPGQMKDKIKNDIKEGVLIAYVVKMDDNNINNPLARILIKPYVEDGYYGRWGRTVWYPSPRIYGDFVENFRESVGAWLDTWQTKRYGSFKIKKGLYSDNQEEIYLSRPIEEWGDYEISNFMNAIILGRNKEWGYGDDGRVNVKGNVSISWENNKFKKDFIDKYPNGFFDKKSPVKFGVINGSFEVFGNFGGDIDIYPTECKNFTIRNNFGEDNPLGNMKDFKNFPLKKIKGEFWVDNTSLTSLEGIPEGMKLLYLPNGYELQSFKGLNEVYGETFNGTIHIKNLKNLTSLEGLPKKINGNLILHGVDNLQSLDGLPKYVKGRLSIYGESFEKYTRGDILKIVKFGSMGKLDF